MANHLTTTRYIDAEQIAKLRAIADRLQGGSDKMRDEGHKLWLIVGEIADQHIEEEKSSG